MTSPPSPVLTLATEFVERLGRWGFLVFFVALFVWCLPTIRYTISNPLRAIPLAPGSHWFWGHLKRILRDPTGAPAREWLNTVPNEGMIRYHMWFKTRILITKPETLTEVLVTHNYDYIKPPIIRNLIGRITGQGLLLQEGEVHKAQRKALSPAFTYRRNKDLYPVFWNKAWELVDCLQRASDAAPSIDVQLWASRVTLDIIGIGGLGRDFDSLSDPDNPISEAYRNVFARPSTTVVGKRLQLLSLILPQYIVTRIPCEHNRIINRSLRQIRDLCAELVNIKRERMLKWKSEDDYDVDALTAAVVYGNFSVDQTVSHALSFLAAGHEANAIAFTSALILLCRRPDVQTRLREEVRKVVPPPTATPTVDPAAIDGCHYLQAVVSEVFRVWAPLPITFRVADRDTRIGTQFIPKGTSLVLCSWAVNASKELWGDDSEEFKPERWLDADGRFLAGGGATSHFSVLSFLQGPRVCIGQKFAHSETACLLAAVIGTFEVDFEPGTALARGELNLCGSFSNKPREGTWCTFRKVPGWA